MKKVAVIGDCHTTRIFEHWDPNSCPVDFQAWGKGGMSAWSFDPKIYFENNEKSSATEHPPFYYDRDLSIVNFQDISDRELIMPWLGYVDIRQMLPGHGDTDWCVRQYVERFINFFDKSTIRFIEPMPQLIPLLIKSPGLHPEYTFEQRLEQNDLFIKYLRELSVECGLEAPVKQEDMFKALGFDQKDMTEDKTLQEKNNHPFDRLDRPHIRKIYDLIIKEASK